ncbi:dehydrogenase [Rhizobium wenxiniae]|jgi:threonine dehydrogenase-like Zn-dependent dehydrogenase|uniref:Threonine dehydrogenase-like Zn-dependent dehydrogenase n=1 Tax=Rhizobium wenxiniae TaxID=1737357 RepID=A0A7X0D157_9HYPH|nr:zinc-binding alcohol dehydrogenase [Rhizobium wenxiniae]MBB6164127.1 threonine dehydrogenase-like Zn-dependent dehydrogenase [Rhizobium wenxiniae]GGG05083.1 dehydrogenase [Rhizobium wenxiniae]
MTMSRALWLTGVRQAELRSTSLGTLGEGELLVESSFGAISRGTEALVAEGAVPASERDCMRAPMQAGNFPFPVKYGYAVVGKVSAGGERPIGQTVFCLHPHQDLFHIPANMAIPVPSEVPAARAVLAANMETALNGIWDAGIMAGDKVTIVGGGLVGLLAGFLAAKVPGTQVTLVDVNPDRGRLAKTLGCSFALPGDAEVSACDSDVVIHASATSDGLSTAIAVAGFEARIVEMSWFGDSSSVVPLGGRFHSHRLSIVGSQVGHVPAARRARWPLSRRLETALALLADDCLDALISGETAFNDLAGRYITILSDPDTLCHRIRYV